MNNSNKFRALVATSDTEVKLTELTESDLPKGDNQERNVLVKVAATGLNFKDAMALGGNSGKIMRSFPMVPGIDLAGRVEKSSSSKFKAGDLVLATGMGLGETSFGGMSEFNLIPDSFLVAMPKGFDPIKAMSFGTAGFTAQLGILTFQDQGIKPDAGPIAVTGATGGVGSSAIALLSRLGYEVVALSHRREQHLDWLKSLGASEVISTDSLLEAKARPLDKPRWAGVIDNLGGEILARLLAQTKPGGVVASIGLAASPNLPTTVLPFILRGVNLMGIDSVYCPMPRRQKVWDAISASGLDPLELGHIEQIPLDRAQEQAAALLERKLHGRRVIAL